MTADPRSGPTHATGRTTQRTGSGAATTAARGTAQGTVRRTAYPDRYQRLLRGLAAQYVITKRSEPRYSEVPVGEWAVATGGSDAIRGALEESLIADAHLTGSRVLADPSLPHHVVLKRATDAAQRLIDLATDAEDLTAWVGEPITPVTGGHQDRADRLLRTVTSAHRRHLATDGNPTLPDTQRRLARDAAAVLHSVLDALTSSLSQSPRSTRTPAPTGDDT